MPPVAGLPAPEVPPVPLAPVAFIVFVALVSRVPLVTLAPVGPVDTGVAGAVVVAVVSAGAVVVALWQPTVKEATASRASKVREADEKFFISAPMVGKLNRSAAGRVTKKRFPTLRLHERWVCGP
jgi:hypothetical protein